MSDDEDDAPALPVAKGSRLPAGRRAVIAKLWRTAKRQVDAHAMRIGDLPKGTTASESDAKALAVLSRTIRELVALDAAAASQEGKPDDDLSPAAGLRHVAELRKELARRLEVLAAEETGAAAEASAGDGDA